MVAAQPRLTLAMISRSIRFQHHPTLGACWVWIGAVSSGGFPTVCVDGGQESARRAVYRHYRGEPPAGRLLTYCGAAKCVNPKHARPESEPL